MSPLARAAERTRASRPEYADAEGFVAAPHFLRWTGPRPPRGPDRHPYHRRPIRLPPLRCIFSKPDPSRRTYQGKRPLRSRPGRPKSCRWFATTTSLITHLRPTGAASASSTAPARRARLATTILGSCRRRVSMRARRGWSAFVRAVLAAHGSNPHLGPRRGQIPARATDCPVGAWDWDQFMAIPIPLD